MSTLASELDIPEITVDDAASFGDRMAMRSALPDDVWLVRNLIGYAVLRYEDAIGVLRDKRWHSASGRIPELMGITRQDFLSRQRGSILSAEGDEHVRLRRLVAPAFNPRAADRLRPFMREVMNSLIDPVAAVGRADFVADVTEPYPIPIICELLGAPRSDWQLFSRLASDVLEIFSVDLLDKLDLVMAAQDELDQYTRDLIAERRSKPADDLLTDLIAAEEAGDKLTNDELVMMVNAVIVGGTDTTRNQLGCAVSLFAEHPDQWALLAERPELAARAVEESMRHFGAVRGTVRYASCDIEYRDVLFPAGTFISIGLAEANHQASVFPDPDRFDITKPAPEQPQLTFGSGIHYCLGASLARAELQEALPLLAQRMPNLRLDGPVTWKPDGVGIFGPAVMPITFDAGH
uniref:Putative cytochrome P450 hydroxylase n=1 Tax=uncultured bacterium A1Q1_fos_1025 TaxID=1256537 RepID=L7VVR8_9BACT|nr:putative cytochrome P450 hydroxylase [uncultured bacterium A1Q1_fos_1025]